MVKFHLEKIVNEKPDYIFFHHDWSNTNSMLACYGDGKKKKKKKKLKKLK